MALVSAWTITLVDDDSIKGFDVFQGPQNHAIVGYGVVAIRKSNSSSVVHIDHLGDVFALAFAGNGTNGKYIYQFAPTELFDVAYFGFPIYRR